MAKPEFEKDRRLVEQVDRTVMGRRARPRFGHVPPEQHAFGRRFPGVAADRSTQRHQVGRTWSQTAAGVTETCSQP
jgi:hypothetical protein